jgi:hypothetical protein
MQPSERLSHTANHRAMRLPAYLIAFLLTLLLASTTPVGTGAGTHQFDLLHPLFSHLHLVNGRWMTHEELATRAVQGETRPSPGAALGAGDSPGSVDGLGVSPVAVGDTLHVLVSSPVAFLLHEPGMPTGTIEAPPDPPPL